MKPFYVVLLGFSVCLSCTSQEGKAVVSAVLAVASTVCDVVDGPQDPVWVPLVCKGLDSAGNVISTFDARAPRLAMVKMACPSPKKDGGLAP